MWFTDQQLRSIPAFARLDPSKVPELTRDAAKLYGYVAANPGIADAALRSWAEGAGILPERFNAARDFLVQTGKGLDVEVVGADAGLAVATEPSLGAFSPGDSVPTEKLTEKELRTVAKRLGVDVPKSATKPEIAEAISRS